MAKKIDKIVEDFMKDDTTENEFKDELESTNSVEEDYNLAVSSDLEEAKELVKDIAKSNKKLRVI